LPAAGALNVPVPGAAEVIPPAGAVAAVPDDVDRQRDARIMNMNIVEYMRQLAPKK
jgi:hypothetical protein